MGQRPSSKNTSSYLGVKATTPPQLIINPRRRPTTSDVIDFEIGTLWLIPLNTQGGTPSEELWILVGRAQQINIGSVGTWIQLYPGANVSAVETLTTDDTVAVPADNAHNINVTGAHNINTSGVILTHDVNVALDNTVLFWVIL